MDKRLGKSPKELQDISTYTFGSIDCGKETVSYHQISKLKNGNLKMGSIECYGKRAENEVL